MRRIAEESGLKAAMDTMTLNTFERTKPYQKALYNTVEQFINSPGKEWLYIGGQPGSGKTHLCTAACVELLERGIPVRYMIWPDESIRISANRVCA
jgi:DNA replication protein DnaC